MWWNLSYVVQFFKCTHDTCFKDVVYTSDFAFSMFLLSSAMAIFLRIYTFLKSKCQRGLLAKLSYAYDF